MAAAEFIVNSHLSQAASIDFHGHGFGEDFYQDEGLLLHIHGLVNRLEASEWGPR